MSYKVDVVKSKDGGFSIYVDGEFILSRHSSENILSELAKISENHGEISVGYIEKGYPWTSINAKEVIPVNT